jgi:glycosyltransferase involved in cell wall biosynthesis
LKITHLIWGLGVGGAETMLVDIANEQAAKHETSVIIVNRHIDPAVASGFDGAVKVVTLGRPPGSVNPWHMLKILNALKRLRPDVLHVHEDSFARLKRLISVPMVLTIHNTRLPLRHGLAAFDSVCCISEAVRLDVETRFPDSRPLVIYNGIRYDAVSRKQQYGHRPFRIVQVGRLAHEQKGQDLLIRALSIALKRMGNDSMLVDFIGDGESLTYLKRLCVECGVEDRCRFLGSSPRQTIYEKLCGYDLLVQPSRYEGFGLTVLEGMAAGLPVLVSNIEGPLEIIAGGKFGWSFRSEDVRELAENLMDLCVLSRAPEFPERMREQVTQSRPLFDVSSTAGRYVNEYSRLALLAKADSPS